MTFAGKSVFDHDIIFWLGDLNFRIEGYSIQDVIDTTKAGADSERLKRMMENDQLIKVRRNNEAFSGFHESVIKFLPTYKFHPGSNNYDATRKPAWTDRILFRAKSDVNNNLGVRQETYEAHMKFKDSDHKPVSALFTVTFD
jgi:hypothetical protein